MKKYILFFMVLIVCRAQGQNYYWSDNTDGNYFTTTNWTPNVNPANLPTTPTNLFIGIATTNNCVLTGGKTNTSAPIYRPSRLNVMTGATMTINGVIYPYGVDSLNGTVTLNSPADFNIRGSTANIGYNGNATVTINSGSLSTLYGLNIGYGRSGSGATINIFAGALNINSTLNLANGTGLSAVLNIDGGAVNVVGALNIGAGGSIFIGGVGFLKMTGDKRSQIRGLLLDGRLTYTSGTNIDTTFDGTYTYTRILQNPNSMITEYPDSVVLHTTNIVCTIQKVSGNVLSYRYKGVETVAHLPNDTHNSMYHDFTTSYGYETIFGATYGVVQDDVNFAHIVIKRPYNPAIHVTPCDAELHYALAKNDVGVYVYSRLEHKPNYKHFDIGSWRQVWWIADNASGINLCERIYTDSLRSWEMNSNADSYVTTPIKEIIQQTSGVRAGKFDGKYEYSLKFWDNPIWGHASNINNIGCWMVNASCEYYNEGPMHHDLNAAAGIIHQCLNGVHYGDGGIFSDTLTSWTKVFGPYMMLITDKATGDANWAAAKARQKVEQALWPYSWVKDTLAYPMATQRGDISGRFMVNDAAKPLQTGANAWVGVTDLSDGATDFQMESKSYQYWIHADSEGYFDIKNVRPGTYSLFAFVNGVVDALRIDNIVVTAAATTSLGQITRNIDRSYGDVAWEIGKPDRSSSEFKLGAFDYCEGFVEQKMYDSFPNPIEYNAASNDWANKLCYSHVKFPTGNSFPGQGDIWKWRINFTLPATIKTTGNARLTIAYASADHAQQYIYVNNESSLFSYYYPNVVEGNSFVRQANHAKYGYNQILIPMNKLKVGANTITLAMPSNSLWVSHLMYDYISLEAVGAAVLPVSLVWFTARKVDEIKAQLDWKTASEENNSYFDIERSTDAITFNSIGKVLASANASNGSNYTFMDERPLDGTNFYRLKQMDKDGKFVYSAIQKVSFNHPLITVYPNPVNNILFIGSSAGNTLKQIAVTDELGKRIIDLYDINSRDYQLNMSGLAKGIYFITINDGTKEVVKKITKQ